MSLHTVSYGSARFACEYIPEARASLALTVYPDMSIVLKHPEDLPLERIEAFVRRKRRWLSTQLAFFAKFAKKKYAREYISGESHLYLGRQYQLIVRKGKEDRVTLLRGKLHVETTKHVEEGIYTRGLLDAWYKEKTKAIFEERMNEMHKNFEQFDRPKLFVRPMTKRWGSAIRNQKIILNPTLIHSSKDCIDYVITHEFCHFTHKNHDKNFWKLLDKKYPNWEKVKEKLELRHG